MFKLLKSLPFIQLKSEEVVCDHFHLIVILDCTQTHRHLFHNLSSRPDPHFMRMFPISGSDVNTIDYNGRTPLHLAAANCNEECLQVISR